MTVTDDFLHGVWPQGGYGWLAGWSRGQWIQHSCELPYRHEARFPQDVYFSVHNFSSNRHRSQCLPSRWIAADLDAVEPWTIDPEPSVATQTSPARYQALWALTEPLDVSTLERVGKALADRVGADRGSWSASKMLRLPGTQNEKYEERPTVSLLWWQPTVCTPDKLAPQWREQRLTPNSESFRDSTDGRCLKTAQMVGQQLAEVYRDRLSASVELLLEDDYVVPRGKRSAAQWLLGRELFEAGATESEIWAILASRPWCKYITEGRIDALSREVALITREISG